MAATLTQERFTGPEWIFERKFDGIRLLAFKKGHQVQLCSRNRLPQNLPALAQAIAKLPHRELILDGEITWRGPLAYHVFDIMWLDGLDVTSLPLEERSALLSELPLAPPLHRVVALNDEAPWERAQNEGWEGVIAKRRGSVYEQRRSPNWLKMKCELAQEFVKRFQARKGTRPTGNAWLAFAGTMVLFEEVLPRAGSLDAEKIRTAALALDLPMGSMANGCGVKFIPHDQTDGGKNERGFAIVGQWQDGFFHAVAGVGFSDYRRVQLKTGW